MAITDVSVKSTPKAEIMEKVLVAGDLSKLTPEERMSYYMAVCESVGLNPLTRPLEYVTLNNKLTLYARKDATDQLRKLNGVSVTDLDAKQMGDLQMVIAKGRDAQGRTDASTGVVNIAGLRGDALANALMKAETKAKRRLTLSLCGLGLLDESEIESIPNTAPETRVVSEPTTNGKKKPSQESAEILAEIGKLVERLGMDEKARARIRGRIVQAHSAVDLAVILDELAKEAGDDTDALNAAAEEGWKSTGNETHADEDAHA